MENPAQVFLFSGHMIDAPNRPEPRFPADKEPLATAAIEAILNRLNANNEDLAICGGACGGDLLFAEVALNRDADVEIHIPFEQDTFLTKSVDFAEGDWRERYFAVLENSRAKLQVAPDELGPLPEGADPYERNNLWMLDSASRFGFAKVHFVCLWNGQGGDGSGGTQHMMNEVKSRSGQVHWLNTGKLW